jgi:hypothetical protein
MDPYLENPVTWPDFHDAMANEIRIELNKTLPAPFYAHLQRRPELGVVLEGGTLHRIVPDPDALLDLQVAASRAYQGGAYLRVIDYLAEPKPPLQAEDAAWADQLLRATGLR